jgi:hypothetical protein
VRRTRIVWKDHERAMLIDRVVALRASDRRSSLLYLLARAQEDLLPPHRRRIIRSHQVVPWFLPAVERAMAEPKPAPAVVGAPRSAVSPPPAVTPSPAVLSPPPPRVDNARALAALAAEERILTPRLASGVETRPAARPRETVPGSIRSRLERPAPPGPVRSHGDPRQTLDELTTEEFLVALARRLLERFNRLEAGVEQIDTGLRDRLNRVERLIGDLLHRPQHRPEDRPPLPGKPRIAIVGLKGDQVSHVQAKCGDRARLTFIDKDRADTSFPEVDWIIVTRFVQHEWTESARRTFPTSRVFYCDGGLSQVVQKIFDITLRQLGPNGPFTRLVPAPL